MKNCSEELSQGRQGWPGRWSEARNVSEELDQSLQGSTLSPGEEAGISLQADADRKPEAPGPLRFGTELRVQPAIPEDSSLGFWSGRQCDPVATPACSRSLVQLPEKKTMRESTTIASFFAGAFQPELNNNPKVNPLLSAHARPRTT